jgi:tetratricopeptide (TPR) repeat protein
MKNIDELSFAVDQEVKKLVDSIFKAADPKKLEPFSQELQDEAKTALIDALSGKSIRERLEKGFTIIFNELTSHESPVVVSSIGSNWEACMQKMAKKSNHPLTEEEQMNSFQESFGVEEETVIQIYNCGLRLFQNQLYEEASDVFCVLSFIDYKRHNAWTALGLSEKKIEKWEPALAAFSMAVITDFQDPVSFLQCGECHIALGQSQDAKECIEKALELLKDITNPSAQKLKEHALTLQKSA